MDRQSAMNLPIRIDLRNRFIPTGHNGRCVGFALVVALCGIRAHGEQPPNPVAQEGLRADSIRADVYFDDSFEAGDAVNRAKKLAAQSRWTEAVELLQKTLDSAGDKLANTASGYYVNVRDVIHEQIAAWPAAGLAAYRSAVEPKIQTKLDALGSQRELGELLALFEQYFCTPTAAKLADTISQLAVESGNLALARRVYRRVLDAHPDRAVHAARYQAMLALIAALDGSEAADPSSLKGSQERMRWMGQDRLLGEVLTEVSSSFTSLREADSSDDWPTFGGRMDRCRIASSRITEPGLLWRVQLVRSAATDRDSNNTEDGPSVSKQRGRLLGIQPVVSGGMIFIQLSRDVIALHRNTGATAWRFQADPTTAGSAGDAEEPVPGAWDSVTVHDGRLVALIPGDPGPFYGSDAARRPAEVVCLDAGDGRILWRSGERERTERGTEYLYDSAPLVDQNRVFVVARRRRSFGFEDVYLQSFDAATGALRFRTHLGSASAGAFGSRTTTTGVAAMHADVVYVCTNLGAIAAVSASTGSVIWLRVYERTAAGASPGATWSSRERPPWELNPVLWSGGRVICQPADSGNLLILAEGDGRLIKSIPLSELRGIQSVLGVSGDVVCGSGSSVSCYDFSADRLLWSAELPEDDSSFGRGQWVNDALWIPTRSGLWRFRAADGQSDQLLWGPDGESGNLVAIADQLVIAGTRGVAAYVRKVDLFNALREKMAAAPRDPLPALELAEVALRAGDLSDAVQVLHEAVRRADALGDATEPNLTRRFFDAVLAFVETLGARSQLDAERLETLFGYASRFPADPPAHVVYRMRFASLFEQRGAPDRALALYQQILRDRTLRELEFSESGRAPQRAGTVAAARITSILDQSGPSIYALYETEARRWLDSGRITKDEIALSRVAETFPNSESAPLALSALGDLAWDSESFEEAARRYAGAYTRYPRAANRPELLKKIADAYDRAARPEQAYRWLTKAAREFPSATIEDQGRSVTFAEYRQKFSGVRLLLEPARPKLALPLERITLRAYDAPTDILSPRFGEDVAMHWRLVFIYSPAGIRALDAQTGIEVWPKPIALRAKPELLLATEQQAIFATAHEVLSLDTSTGQRKWSHGNDLNRFDDPNVDWEAGETLRLFALQRGRLVTVRDGGRMTCLSLDSGETIWSEVHRPVPTGRIRWLDRRIAFDVTQDDRTAVGLVDGNTGQWQGTIPTEEQRAVEELLLTLDGKPVLVTARSISAYDPETRVMSWRLPVEGRIRRDSLCWDMDAIYFTDDGLHLQKVDLEQGTVSWRTDRLFTNREDDVQVERRGEQLIVSSLTSVGGVDTQGGIILWRGTPPKDSRFVRRLITDSYVAAVHLPALPAQAEGTVYFYDHRNASGILPKMGGILELGPLTDVRTILAADQSLWMQTGTGLQVWAGK